MANSQVPWGVDALSGTVSDPAWRSKPSWYLIVTDGRMIPPPLHRAMAERAGATTAEVPGSHAIYVSHATAWPTSSPKRPSPSSRPRRR